MDHMCVATVQFMASKGVKIFHYLAFSFSSLNCIIIVSGSSVSFSFPGFNVVPQRNVIWRSHCIYDEGTQQWSSCPGSIMLLRFSACIPTSSNRKLGGPQGWSECCREEQNVCPLQESNTSSSTVEQIA